MQTLNWFLLAAMLFFFASWIGSWSENNSLQAQIAHKEELLDKKEAQIVRMHSDHLMAMNAAKEALQLRKEIGEYERERMCAAEKALGKNSDYCDGLVPDDVRLLWPQDKPPGASGLSAGGH